MDCGRDRPAPLSGNETCDSTLGLRYAWAGLGVRVVSILARGVYTAAHDATLLCSAETVPRESSSDAQGGSDPMRWRCWLYFYNSNMVVYVYVYVYVRVVVILIQSLEHV